MARQFKKWLVVFAVAGIAAGAPSSALAQNLLDWQAMGGSGPIQSYHSNFTLYNVSDREALKYGSRTWGINLVWDRNTNLGNIRFDKQSGSGDVKYGEPVAVYIKGGGFLKWEKRRVGINLAWSNTPVYEWRIGGGEPSQSVMFGERIALLNDRTHDAMIYGKRPAGVNLIWLKDYGKGTWGRIWDAAKSQVKSTGSAWLKNYLGI